MNVMQTKPLRSYGIDVTQTSMQPILESLGITDRSVKQMSQAEKEILRYLATLKQAQVAMGDYANTIESPANQMKVFKQQLVESKVALTSLFIGGFANILPYANALLMVVTEISKAIADMFGIELQDYNSGIASSEDAYDSLADSIDGTTDSIKELKRQTLGFDQIHNINENNDSGSGSNLTGGIDQRLLDAIYGYDNGMDKVRMKATEIRDSIMEWLGFTKEIDPLTGEVGFKYQGMKQTLNNLLSNFKKLNIQGKIFVGLGLYLLISKLFNNSKKLTTAIGSTGLLGNVKKILTPMKSLYSSLDNVNYANKSLTQGLSEGITNWSKSLTAMDKAKVSLVGILGLTTSMTGMASAMKSVSDEGWNLSNSLGAVASGIGGIASGAYIGSIFGPWGTVIGGATGAVLELVSAINGYETAGEKMIATTEQTLEASKQNLQSYYDTKKAIEDEMNANLAQTEYHQRLIDELNSIVSANGKVKEGYEDRVNFILNELNKAYGTEYSIIDGTIDGYDELNKSIQDVIQTKKSEIMLEAEKENYTNAIKNQTQAWKDYNETIKKMNKTNEEANELIDKKYEMESLLGTSAYRNYKYYSALTEKTYQGHYAYQAIIDDLETYDKLLTNNQETLENNRTKFENYTNDIIFYEDLQTAVLSENVEKQNQLIEDRLNQITTANGEEKLSLSEQIKYYEAIANQKKKIYEENGREITNELELQLNSQKDALINSLKEQSQTVDSLSTNVINSWKDLAQNSTNEFVKAFNDLPSDVQEKLFPKLQLTGTTLSNVLNSGIRFDGSNIYSGWNKTVSTLWNTASKVTGLFGFNLPSLSSLKIPMFANGGFPEDGLFFANHNELVGNFSNGKTAVANNTQIIEGIKAGVYEAVVSAMNQSSGQASQIDVHLHTDEGVVVDKINQITKQTGVFPLNIPI